MGRKIIIWFVIFTVLLLIVPFFWGTYNRLIKREENVKMAWSQVENQYQRRADLIMNLVETVKGYASHEQETFRQVIEARANATNTNIESDQLNAENLQQFSEKQAELSYALSRLIMIVENYPDLKANENFIRIVKYITQICQRPLFGQKSPQYIANLCFNMYIYVNVFLANKSNPVCPVNLHFSAF